MFRNALFELASPSIDPRIGFWRDQSRWPIDAGGFIFAARAIQRLGRRILGEQWNEEAPLTALHWALPDKLSTSTPHWEIERGLRLLRHPSSEYSRRLMPRLGYVADNDECDFPTTAEWREAVARSKALQKVSWAQFRPFIDVAVVLDGACRRGVVRTATRSPSGGAFEEQPWEFWNSEQAWLRFDLCRVPNDDPYRTPNATEPYRWIFIDQTSLDEFAGGKETAVVGERDDPSLIERVRSGSPGRPPKYDWQAFADELFRKLESGELPESVHAAADTMLQWCLETWGEEPATSMTRDKTKTFLIAFAAARKSR